MATQNSSNVNVRNAKKEDASFLGEMLVESFYNKFKFAVGQKRIPAITEVIEAEHSDINPEDADMFFSTQYIAEVDGKPAGVLALKFHGSREARTRHGLSYYCRNLGCCASLSYMYMGCLLYERVPVGKCYIDHIAVKSEFRGKGIGKILMEKAEEAARQNNCQILYLWVASGNRAKNLYERQGFQVVDVQNSVIIYWAVGLSEFIRMEKHLQY